MTGSALRNMCFPRVLGGAEVDPDLSARSEALHSLILSNYGRRLPDKLDSGFAGPHLHGLAARTRGPDRAQRYKHCGSER
jgi:hypothetical protein